MGVEAVKKDCVMGLGGSKSGGDLGSTSVKTRSQGYTVGQGSWSIGNTLNLTDVRPHHRIKNLKEKTTYEEKKSNCNQKREKKDLAKIKTAPMLKDTRESGTNIKQKKVSTGKDCVRGGGRTAGFGRKKPKSKGGGSTGGEFQRAKRGHVRRSTSGYQTRKSWGNR